MPANLFDQAIQKIESFFENSSKKSFTETALESILKDHRLEWSIPYHKSVSSFITYLQKKSKLKAWNLYNPSNSQLTIYSWETGDELTIFSGIKNKSYYTHYTAMFLHGLTEQIPKTFYLNAEHSQWQSGSNTLSQDNIDAAFSKEQRKTSVQYTFNQSRIILLNGQRTDNLGVLNHRSHNEAYSFTDLTRTIIDVSIRPAYSGGVFEVLKAYQTVKGKLDIKLLRTYLDRLSFVYPYHQLIGFYLEQAGYSESDLQQFDMKKEFNFYLTYNMNNPQFNERWKLYYPRGMESIRTKT